MQTSHSEFGRITEMYIKRVEDSFLTERAITGQWEELNYLAKPDLIEAKQEYASLVSIFESANINLHYFSRRDHLTMDSIYCRDATIMTDFGVILCNMGKQLRQTEPVACQIDYEESDIHILGAIQGDAHLEGGDVAWLDSKTLAVAHGYRTNDKGFEQLSNLLKPHGITLIQVDLPHYKGQSDVFHLMSIFSPIDKDKAVVYSPLMPVRFRKELLDRAYQLIEVPESEFESMGCNVLAIAPSQCVTVKGNSETKELLQKAGCQVIEYEGQEISIKGGGGPTCLTRPIKRFLD